MDFGLLGPLVVRDGGRDVPVSAPRQRVLLAALLLSGDRVVSLDALAETLWDTEPPTGARGALHSAVQRLRSALGPSGAELIETRPPGYVMKVGDRRLDVRDFGVLAARGHACAEAGDWARAASLLREALALWRGEPLADIPSQLLRDREVPPIEDQRLRALAARIDADMRLRRHAEVVPELRQLVAAHPLREQFHAQLMLSLYCSGRQADALAAYQDVRRLLADKLGLDPGPALRLLHQRILAADSDLLMPPAGEQDGPAATALSLPAAVRPVPSAAHRTVVPRQLPAVTRHFTGRAGALRALTALAAEATGAIEATVIAVIDGTAGIGKTTLAVHFAHKVAGQFPDGQLYVNLRGFDPSGQPMGPAEVIRLFLDALAVPASAVPASLDAQAGLYRSLLAGKRVLVLLDNARDVDQVRPLLPASPGCLVLVTSRNQLMGLVAVEGAFPLSLEMLADTEARDLLSRHLGPDRVDADADAADALIRLCARLPLALSVAAARIASQPGLSLVALTDDLRAGRRLDALCAGHAAADVRTVFSWSYEQLDVAAARLFRLLALHVGPAVSTAAAASMAGLPLDAVRRNLGELASARLVMEHTPARFSCHDLLRAYAAELNQSEDSEAERHAATGRMLDHYLHTAAAAALQLHPTRKPLTLAALGPGAAPELIADAGHALAWFEAERPVLMAAAERALEAGFCTHAWQISWALSRFLDVQGRWHDWEAIERVSLTATQRLGDHVAEASAHQRFGAATARCGNYADAHAHLDLALGICDELGDYAGLANVHNCLALTLNYQGCYQEALGHARQALEWYTVAGDLPGRAMALNSVGWFHVVLGDHERALGSCQQALGLFRDIGSREGVANALDSLGYVHQHLGNHTEATVCYQEALSLQRELGGRWGEAEALGHLGDARHAAGDPVAARAAWEEALAILDDLKHPDAAAVRAKLGASKRGIAEPAAARERNR